MHHILPDREIGIPDHAVGLGNTGESSKGQDTQHQVRSPVPQDSDPSCNLQKSADSSRKQFRLGGRERQKPCAKHRQNEKEIKKNHVTAQLCNP